MDDDDKGVPLIKPIVLLTVFRFCIIGVKEGDDPGEGETETDVEVDTPPGTDLIESRID